MKEHVSNTSSKKAVPRNREVIRRRFQHTLEKMQAQINALLEGQFDPSGVDCSEMFRYAKAIEVGEIAKEMKLLIMVDDTAAAEKLMDALTEVILTDL